MKRRTIILRLLAAAHVAVLAACGRFNVDAALVPAGIATVSPATPEPSGTAQRYMYVFDYDAAQIDVLTFPQGTFVRSVDDIGTLCTDPTNGNVLVVNGKIDVYAPGATRLITSLAIPLNYVASGCAVDPRTGTIAAIGGNYVSNPQTGAVFVWSKRFRGPTVYNDRQTAATFNFGSYDENDNLFVNGGFNGAILNELPKGTTSFVKIVARGHRGAGTAEGSVEWDGKYITVEKPLGTPSIYRLVIAGSEATVVSTVRLHGDRSNNNALVPTWIDRHAVVAPSNTATTVKVWSYPRGGAPVRSIGTFQAALDVVVGP